MENKYALCNTLEAACNTAKRWKSNNYRVVAVEAEYGDKDVTDECPQYVDESLAHHGPRHENPAPCERWDLYGTYKESAIFVLSHVDADALLGVAICQGSIPDTEENRKLSELAAWVDKNGPHRGPEHPLWSEQHLRLLTLNWQISVFNKKIKSRELNFTAEFKKLLGEGLRLMDDPQTQQEALESYQRQQENVYDALEKHVTIKDKLHVFNSASSMTRNYYVEARDFVSHADVIVQYNQTFKSITLAVYDEETAERYFGPGGVITPLVEFFGEGAGGRKAIGGSPRGVEYKYSDMLNFVRHIRKKYLDG